MTTTTKTPKAPKAPKAPKNAAIAKSVMAMAPQWPVKSEPERDSLSFPMDAMPIPEAKPAVIINPMSKRPDVSTDIFKSTLTITFGNGKNLEIDAMLLTPEIQLQAMLHGLKQKLVDAAAIARDLSTGRSVSVNDKFDAVNEVYNRLLGTAEHAPSWNKVRDAAAPSNNSGNTLLVKALMMMTGKTRAETDEFLAPKTKEQKAALRENPRVIEAIAKIQAASAKTPAIDTDAMLQELG